MNARRLLICLAMTAGTLFGQVQVGVNLVRNGDFENLDLSDWTIERGSVTHTAYTGVFYPGPDVAAAMNGGRFMLRGLTPGSGDWCIIRQSFDVSALQSDIDVENLQAEYSAWFGGYREDLDYAELRLSFLDANGTATRSYSAINVGRDRRNRETTLVSRLATPIIPRDTRQLLLEVLFHRDTGTSMEGVIDNVNLTLRRLTSPPPAVPYGTNLVKSPSFERDGVINPADFDGWRVDQGLFATLEYGASLAPDPSVSAQAGAGDRMLMATTWGSGEWAYLSQNIDVRGNAAEIDAGRVEVDLRALLGGRGSDSDYARVYLYFHDEGRTSAFLENLNTGSMTRTARNYETNMVPRERSIQLPTGTRWILVRAEVQREDGSQPINGYIDEIDVRLVLDRPAPTPKPYDTNLVVDPDFESTHVMNPAHPSWVIYQGLWQTTEYGESPGPGTDVSAALGGGNRYLQARSWSTGEWAYIYQDIDVSGNETAIDAGQLWAHASIDQGGRANNSDYGRLEIRYLDGAGTTITSEEINTPNTSRGWRNYATMMNHYKRKSRIPIGTRSIRVWLEAQREVGNTPMDVYFDNVSLEISDDERATPPVPLNVELMDGGDMERLEFKTITSRYLHWYVYEGGRIETLEYGTAGYPTAPYGAGIGGGTRFLMTPFSGNRQQEAVLDLSGNAAEIDAGGVALRASGLFGGIGSDNDDCALIAYADDVNGTYLNQALSVGYVSPSQRQNQSVLLPREGTFILPPGTRRLRLRIYFRVRSGSVCQAMMDNISFQLVRPEACGSASCIEISSSDDAWALAVPGDLPTQVAALNAGPPSFSSNSWSRPFRKNENANPALLRAFSCGDPGVIPLNESFVDANAYLGDADEVTLDNCGSAFYRFTFTMPSSFLNATLLGVANADDQAVVFLNGQRISGEMGLANVGSDSLDANGLRILTSPTRDQFFTNDASLFVSGTNELVFAVCGDAAATDPTGIEFTARVLVDSAATLSIDSPVLSATSGGQRNYFIDAGPGYGSEPYMMFATLAGMWPGMDLGGYLLPLNRDGLFDLTATAPNTVILGSGGVLSTSGFAFARWALPPLPPALVGFEVSHAAIVGVPGAPGSLVSNPVLLTVIP